MTDERNLVEFLDLALEEGCLEVVDRSLHQVEGTFRRYHEYMHKLEEARLQEVTHNSYQIRKLELPNQTRQ